MFVRLAELACSPCETEWEPEEDVGIRCDDGDNLCGSDEDKVGGDREDDSCEERFDLKKGLNSEIWGNGVCDIWEKWVVEKSKPSRGGGGPS